MASKWIQASTRKMDEKGTRGSFSRIAARMGDSTEEAADKITAHPEKHTEKERKKAQWMKNVQG